MGLSPIDSDVTKSHHEARYGLRIDCLHDDWLAEISGRDRFRFVAS